MQMFENLFGTAKPVIGVIHLEALPGSCQWRGDLEEVFLRAEQEAVALSSGGVDGIIVENFFDAPFAKDRVDVATACAMSLAVKRVMAVCDLPIGINVLRNDALTAMAVAVSTGAKFIRVNILTGAMVTDQGIIESVSHQLHMYRRQITTRGAVKVFADIMVKHALPVGFGADIAHAAKDAVRRALADAVVVSGAATGDAPDLEELNLVRSAVPDTPILIGSGTSAANVKALLGTADGIIVASSLKRQGVLENPIDLERVRSLMSVVNQAR